MKARAYGNFYLLPLNSYRCLWAAIKSFFSLFFCFHLQHSEEVCILSASGTAAILNPRYMREGCLDLGGSDQRWFVFVLWEEFYFQTQTRSKADAVTVDCLAGLRIHLLPAVASVTSHTMSSTCHFLPSSRTASIAEGKRFLLILFLFKSTYLWSRNVCNDFVLLINHFWRFLMCCLQQLTCHQMQLLQEKAALFKPGKNLVSLWKFLKSWHKILPGFWKWSL